MREERLMTAREKYLELMKLRQTKPSDAGEVHEHHIVPVCMNPEKNATVKLSVQEHTLAHYWLWKWFRSGRKKTRAYAQGMFAAYKGLRDTWFGRGHYRYLFQKDKAFAKYEKSAAAQIQKEYRELFDGQSVHGVKEDA